MFQSVRCQIHAPTQCTNKATKLHTPNCVLSFSVALPYISLTHFIFTHTILSNSLSLSLSLFSHILALINAKLYLFTNVRLNRIVMHVTMLVHTSVADTVTNNKLQSNKGAN